MIRQVPEFYILPTYWNWIKSEAALIDTDGCSGVTGLRIDCCFEHDLGYYYAKDPHDAYIKYRGGLLEPWLHAKSIDRAGVDARFRKCLQNRSALGRWSPMALWRWAGVRIGGESRWEAHREREKQEGVA